MKYVAAIDIGGTSIKATLVSEKFEVIATKNSPTPKGDPTGIETAHAIAAIVGELSDSKLVSSVGFAIPGTLDEERGISRWTGNLGWKDLPTRELIEREVQLPVAFGHDLPCVCGLSGCLETISSAARISREYEKCTGFRLSAREILKRSRSDDQALQVWDRATAYLAVAIEDLITILAPEAIVFGGGLSQAGSALLDPISAIFVERLTFQRRPELLIAHHGASAGTIGCAIMALDLLSKESA